MIDPTSATLLDAMFSRLSPTEIRGHVARSTSYFADPQPQPQPQTQHGAPAVSALDPLPFVVSRDAANLFSEAARQWGRLLEIAYRDVRGEQFLVEQGVIPGEVLWRDAGLDPAFNSLDSATRDPLGVIRLDLMQDAGGGWLLVGVESGVPNGLGYSLELRVIHGRVYSALSNRSRVLRLAPFFRSLKQNWFAAALHHREEPGVMFWTRGPVDPNYSEHVYLCRYFGYPLVESRDLTVGSGKLFLKMLGGLRPVDVLVRMVGDVYVDPLVGNPPPLEGVAGLVQAVRDGEVVVTNMPGSDVLSDQSLLPHLSSAAAEVLGSPLAIPYAPSCDNPAREPFWHGEEWVHLPFVVSLFAARTEQRWELMPGGIARPLQGERREGGSDRASGIHPGEGCKDLWFLSPTSVPFVSLLPQRDRPSAISRTADLPSRVADDLFWLGRYSERAWVDLRFLGKWLQMSSGEHDESFQDRFEIMRACIAAMKIGDLEPSVSGTGFSWRLWETLRDMQGVASRIRDRFSVETHGVIGKLSALAHRVPQETSALRRVVDQGSLYLAALNGFTNEHMTRGAGWRFLDMGKRLERASLLVETVESFVEHEPGPDDLTLLLELFDSMITYRNRYYFAPELAPVLDLLILDESNPRSLAFQVAQILEHLERLPHPADEAYRSEGEHHALKLHTAISLAEGPALVGPPGGGKPTELAEFLTAVRSDLSAISEAINRSYLVKLEALQRMQALDGAEAT